MRINFKDYRQLLVTYLAPLWPQVTILALLLCGDIALQLLNPQMLRLFIDTITTSGLQEGLLGIAFLFIAVAVLQQAVKLAATYFSERVGWTARLPDYQLTLYVYQRRSAAEESPCTHPPASRSTGPASIIR